MDESGYTADQCTIMRDNIPSLLETVKNLTDRVVAPDAIYAAISNTLVTKFGQVNSAGNASAPSGKTFKRARIWLRNSESGDSAASYEAESEDSFESLSSRGRSRDHRHRSHHGRCSHREPSSRDSRYNHHRPSSPRQSSRPRRGSNDTVFPRSSRSGNPKTKTVRIDERSGRRSHRAETDRSRSESS